MCSFKQVGCPVKLLYSCKECGAERDGGSSERRFRASGFDIRVKLVGFTRLSADSWQS